MATVKVLQVNGVQRMIEADSERTLLSVLRDDLDLTGSKYGCGEGRCGACTVLVDGRPVRSCTTRVGSAEGKPIRTVEGLARGEILQPRPPWKRLDSPGRQASQSRWSGRAKRSLPEPTSDPPGSSRSRPALARTGRSPPGNSTTTTREAPRSPHLMRSQMSARSFTPAIPPCARVLTAPWRRPRTPLHANRTWTIWRMPYDSIRSNCVART